MPSETHTHPGKYNNILKIKHQSSVLSMKVNRNVSQINKYGATLK